MLTLTRFRSAHRDGVQKAQATVVVEEKVQIKMKMLHDDGSVLV